MVNEIFKYLDTLIASGWNFFLLLLPLVIVYAIFRAFRTIYRDGDLLWVLIYMVFIGSGMGLGVYALYQGVPWYLCMCIGFVGLFLGFYFGDKFMPERKDDLKD